MSPGVYSLGYLKEAVVVRVEIWLKWHLITLFQVILNMGFHEFTSPTTTNECGWTDIQEVSERDDGVVLIENYHQHLLTIIAQDILMAMTRREYDSRLRCDFVSYDSAVIVELNLGVAEP